MGPMKTPVWPLSVPAHSTGKIS